MNAFVNTFVLCYAALFPIISPIGNIPLFLSLTRAHPDAVRSRMARKVAFNSFLMLLGSLFAGSYVLEFFGLSLPIVRIGGGVVVAALGWRLLNSGENVDTEAAAGSQAPALDSFYPLTMPLTVGPGAISVSIALGSQRPSSAGLAEMAVLGAGALTSLLAISITVYLCYRSAEGIMAKLGQSGMNVLSRMSAFILLCIGIQITWAGVQGLLATL
jgi:multiple antibiotic resistance protein